MTTYRLDLEKAQNQRPLKDLSERECDEICAMLQDDDTDKSVFVEVMDKYKVSMTTIIILLAKRENWWDETERPIKSTTAEALKLPEEDKA